MQEKQTKPRSYLSEVKQKLTELMVNAEHVEDVSAATDDLEAVWQVVRPAIAQSYWNGVEHGATGRVKPKGSQPQRRRGQ